MKDLLKNVVIRGDKNQIIQRPVISREDIITRASEECLDAMLRASYPSTTLEEYTEEHRKLPEEERADARLFNAHYLPQGIYEIIEGDFIDAYQLQSDLPMTIAILEGYFKEPLSDGWNSKTKQKEIVHQEPMDEETYKTVEKYLDMANNFYRWDREENSLRYFVSNYGPSSNRETVEQWWHEHGDPDFKLPEDSYWVDEWDNAEEDNQDIN